MWLRSQVEKFGDKLRVSIEGAETAAQRRFSAEIVPDSEEKTSIATNDPVEVSLEDPISFELMENPVIAPCGHSFSQRTITEWLQSYQACPICRTEFGMDDLRTNFKLQQVIEEYRANHRAFGDAQASDAESQLSEEQRKAIEEAKRKFDALVKPRIMIVGETGSGKSSLVNRVFRCNLAEVGYGRPVTQWTKKWKDVNYRVPIILYDTKGIELGDPEFTKTTGDFLQSRQSLPVAKRIHCIWYVISLTHGRFQDFEIDVCRNAFKDIPIFVVLTKCDAVIPVQVAMMKQAIFESNLDVQGIFVVSTLPEEELWKKPLRDNTDCPTCHSTDTYYRAATQMWTCADCAALWPAEFMPNDIQTLVEKTCEILPEIVQQAFAEGQQVSLALKINACMGIIAATTTSVSVVAASPIPFVGSLFVIPPLQTAMFFGLARVWGLPLWNYPKLVTIYASVEATASLTGLGLGNILKLIPGVGSVLGGVINFGVAGLMTSSLGVAYSLGLHETVTAFPGLADDPSLVKSIVIARIISKYLRPKYLKKIVLQLKQADGSLKKKIENILMFPPPFDQEDLEDQLEPFGNESILDSDSSSDTTGGIAKPTLVNISTSSDASDSSTTDTGFDQSPNLDQSTDFDQYAHPDQPPSDDTLAQATNDLVL